MDLLKYLAYIWVTDGYQDFKQWCKDIGLTKNFSIKEIRATILNEREIMKYYIKDSAFNIIENRVYQIECNYRAKECLNWYEDNSHNL
jgi:hypothetical protein